MKLLLDENLSRRLVPFLQHDYPGTSQVVLLGLESASDRVVWQKAKDDGYVVVTKDADFQELSLVWGSPPQVIRLRTPNWDTAAGHAVLTAAGGVVCQPNNSPLTYAEPAKTLNPFFVAWGVELWTHA
jgi:predicted nuclease of predicted toxin-antitoxin system